MTSLPDEWPELPVHSCSPRAGATGLSANDDETLDFDFFEEDATREAPVRVRDGNEPRRGGGSGGRGPRRPGLRPTDGLTPLLRLVGLIAFAIVIVVLLAVWAEGCSSDRKRETYGNYMTQVGDVGTASAAIGSDLATMLTEPGLKQATLETNLGGLIQRQRQDARRAEGLDVPGPLRPPHDGAAQALELRAAGMEGLLAVFRATATSKDATAAGEQLAVQARRLVAGDVVWQDFFRLRASGVLASENLADVTVPQSVFVENAELYSARSLTQIWQRIHGASTGGTPTGVHGTGIEYTLVAPAAGCTQGCSGANGQLSADTEATVRASTDLGFVVGVTNTGENQEVQVKVTLTVPKGTSPIVKTQTIDLIDVGETKTATFKDFPPVPFGEQTTIQVSVEPVPGEQNGTNNTAEYPVIFSLE